MTDQEINLYLFDDSVKAAFGLGSLLLATSGCRAGTVTASSIGRGNVEVPLSLSSFQFEAFFALDDHIQTSPWTSSFSLCWRYTIFTLQGTQKSRIEIFETSPCIFFYKAFYYTPYGFLKFNLAMYG